MSLLSPLEHFIHRLDTEAAAELSAVKADVEDKLAQVMPVLDNLKSVLQSAATDAAEQAVPGLKAALAAAVADAEAEFRRIFGLS